MINGCDMVKQEDPRTAVTRLEVTNWRFNLQFQGTLKTEMWQTREPRQSTNIQAKKQLLPPGAQTQVERDREWQELNR